MACWFGVLPCSPPHLLSLQSPQQKVWRPRGDLAPFCSLVWFPELQWVCFPVYTTGKGSHFRDPLYRLHPRTDLRVQPPRLRGQSLPGCPLRAGDRVGAQGPGEWPGPGVESPSHKLTPEHRVVGGPLGDYTWGSTWGVTVLHWA